MPQKLSPHHFNSIKVRLELSASSVSITTPGFQFHKGTIRTQGINTHQQRNIRNFNSIKVRLELESPDITLMTDLDFNSIKVRLERSVRNATIKASGFQFHKGTIRTKEV